MKTSLQEEELIHLLNKYIDNTCTPEEAQVLIGWIRGSADTTCYDFVSQSRWSQMSMERPSMDELHENALRNEALRLLDMLEAKQKHSVGNKKYVPKRWLSGVAAVMILLLGMAFWKYYDGKTEHFPLVTEKEFIAEKGEMKHIQLKDSTQITLNSGSRLYVPSDFNGDTREVRIDGEAFFQVTPNPSKPFVVSSGEVKVKVLGTSFNVNSYSEDTDIAVTVSTGKVLVGMEDRQMQMQLLPNEHISINKETGNVHKDQMEENNYVKWMDGYLYFDKLPLQQVIKMINRKYNTQIILQCKNCNMLISGMHDNRSLEAVIGAVCFIADLKYRMEGDTIILYDKD